MPQTQPATQPVPASKKKLQRTRQDEENEFLVLLTQMIGRAQALGIVVRYGPMPVPGGAPRGDSKGEASMLFDGIFFTGEIKDDLVGVKFLPDQAFHRGDKVLVVGTAMQGEVTAYNGRSPASGLPEYTVQLLAGEAQRYRQDQISKL